MKRLIDFETIGILLTATGVAPCWPLGRVIYKVVLINQVYSIIDQFHTSLDPKVFCAARTSANSEIEKISKIAL